MGEQPANVGHFVWHDLMTSDVDKAKDFYSQLLGWTSREMDSPWGSATVFSAGGTDVGDVTPLAAELELPSHWTCYIGVADLDAAVAKAKELGGEVAVEPFDLPPWGRMAVVKDPGGAYFQPFQGGGEPPEPAWPPPAGTFCWFELLTPDVAQASDFYGQVIGWRTEAATDVPDIEYHLFKRGEDNAAGLMKLPEGVPVSHWLMYVAVPDVDAATARAEELGATVLHGPFDVPGTGRMSTILDPTGAAISLFTAAPM
jgi:predicted enzyme related to lactoylglutathione lyase